MQTIRLGCGAAIFFLIFVSSAHAATFAVNSPADPGDGVCDATCTLRDAIIAANANAGSDTIDFAGIVAPTATSPVTIVLGSGLPLITDTIIMDASITETRVLPGSPVKRPGLELSLEFATPVVGPALEFHPDGLNLSGPGASNSIIRGFVINGLDSSTHSQCLLAESNPDPFSTPANPFPRQGYCGVPISIFGANGVVVAGNYLNLDADGVAPVGAGKAALEIVDGSDNLIGGYGANDRNVMTAAVPQPPGVDLATMVRPWLFGWSAPAFGAPKKANNNQIIGNYIGLTAEGVSLDPILRGIWLANWNVEDDVPLFGPGPLGWGVQCDDQVLDPCEMVGNVVEGNTITATGGPSSVAIFGPLEDTLVNDNTIFNTAPGFPFPPPYGRIEVFELTGLPGLSNPEPGIPVNMVISNNRLGIDSAGNPSGRVSYGIGVGNGRNIVIAGNTVTGAAFDAIVVNFSNPPNLSPQNVTITENSLFDNAWINELFGVDIYLGIALNAGDGVTPNDFQDLDTGANNLQNLPVLTYAQDYRGQIRVLGHLNSEPNKSYRIEFFANDVVNASGHGEGERFLGSVDVTTNRGGNAVLDTKGSLEVEIGGGLVDIGDFVTATATELCTTIPEEGECPFGTAGTSEFSLAIEVTESD
jgi:CSLREA domain-containing protein